MSTIDNVVAGLNPQGNQHAIEKNNTKSTESSAEEAKRAVASDPGAASEVKVDTVEINSNRIDHVESIQAVPKNEAEAAALLADIQRLLQQEERQQLEQIHSIRPESMVELLS